MGSRAWGLLAALVVSASSLLPATGYSAPIEKVAPTIQWAAGTGPCVQVPMATPQAAFDCLLQLNDFCTQYDDLTQENPDLYKAWATVYQTCNPQTNVRLNPTHVGAALINAVTTCTTPYDGNPSDFYNSPGYQFQLNLPDTYRTHGYCWIYVMEIDRTQKPADNCVGNPILPATGGKRQEETDYPGAGSLPLTFSRIYNTTPAGRTWATNYSRSVSYAAGAVPTATLVRADGRFTFTRSGSSWIADADVNYQLTGNNGGFVVLTPDRREREVYDGDNQLRLVQSASTVTKYTLTYSTSSTPSSVAPVPGLLIGVSNAFGHTLNLTYDSASQLSTMTDPAGGLYQYGYDSNGDLVTVTYPDGNVRQYLYNEPAYTGGGSYPHALTGIVDESNARFANFGYSAGGLAALTEHAGGADRHAVSYGGLPTLTTEITFDVGYHVKYVNRYYQGSGTVTVTDALGQARNYTLTTLNGVIKTTGSDKLPTRECTNVAQSQTFDANGNPATRTDFNGILTTYAYDTARNLETSRTEASGTALARTTTTGWDATFRLPALITDPDRTTAYTYDSSGNVATKTVTDTSVSPNVSRTWAYSFTGYRQLLSENGPRTDVSDVTTYTYYSCSTGFQCGQVKTATNAMGHVTTYNTYDAHGQPLTITDPNGIVTTLMYDARQRLTSRQVGAETTTLQYWPTGLLKKVTLPDASYLLYGYDDAHRLVSIEDGAGNRVEYTLDAMGNRTAENV